MGRNQNRSTPSNCRGTAFYHLWVEIKTDPRRQTVGARHFTIFG
ncbi:hypothetical protein [Microseira wollei]|nr:hypothetical protein [Microseira wollei]